MSLWLFAIAVIVLFVSLPPLILLYFLSGHVALVGEEEKYGKKLVVTEKLEAKMEETSRILTVQPRNQWQWRRDHSTMTPNH
ncbi:unnamed protein product [Arabidopsis lyrata]|nr:unnamed protein product [Arabidopsis lyrata]